MELTPSFLGRECIANGRQSGIDRHCEKCDHYLTCFPDTHKAAAYLYHEARSIPPHIALDLIRQAKTEEERNFWAYIADMNLQRRQKEVIAQNQF